jgi:hypothetical protein
MPRERGASAPLSPVLGDLQMQINENLSVTRAGLLCSRCGLRSSQDLLAGRSNVCRHASAGEVVRILRLLEDRHRRRDVPSREVLSTVESQNHNGTYTVSVVGDGSLVCSCLSFLGSRDLEEIEVRPGVRTAACKHVRPRETQLLSALRDRTFQAPKVPTDWQKLVFKAFSIEPHERLSSAQAYWAIHDLLEKQGVDYLEFEERMRTDVRTTLLPINAFGVEFEGFGVPTVRLAQALSESGVPTATEGYNHETRDHFKVVSDSSIQGQSPFELVTPKLFGAHGFERIRTLCRVAARAGADANVTTGLHVHVDAWNCTIRDARHLLTFWHHIQPVVLMLVPPSRRANSYCKPVTPEWVAAVNAMRSLSSIRQDNRYYNLNLAAYGRHGTFEFRLHSGTFNADKVISWVVFVLLVTAAARRGIDVTSVPQTWEGVSKAIGLQSGTSVIRQAHRYLSQRYTHFTQNAAASSGGAVA